MIAKPPPGWGREAPAFTNMRRVAVGGVSAVRAVGCYARGLVCWGLALLWGAAALAGGLGGSLPTFLGVGAMAAVMAWSGSRLFARARGLARGASA